jgi:hypothetical protein
MHCDELSVNEVADFAAFARLAKAQARKGKDSKLVSEIESPIFKSEYYDELPELLRDISQLYPDSRQKDITLLSSITAIGSLFNNVRGYYDREIVYPMLYLVVVAPPASGKGVMIHSRTIISKALEKVNKPFFIPGNTSASALINQLKESSSVGLIIESESDTITNAFKQDWGSYSDLLRKAFHHEPISKSRVKKMENGSNGYETVEIENPKLGMIISGTPATVKKFIASEEDGLFSRVIFYGFNEASVWRSVRPSLEGKSRGDDLNNIANRISALYDAYVSKDIVFNLSDDQWNVLDYCFDQLLRVLHLLDDTATQSIVKRGGLIFYRIAMILSISNTSDPSKKLTCSDQDFRSALRIIMLNLKHNYLQHLRSANSSELREDSNLRKLYDLLEDNIGYRLEDLVRIAGDKLNVSRRSVFTYKDSLCKLGMLKRCTTNKCWYKVKLETSNIV